MKLQQDDKISNYPQIIPLHADHHPQMPFSEVDKIQLQVNQAIYLLDRKISNEMYERNVKATTYMSFPVSEMDTLAMQRIMRLYEHQGFHVTYRKAEDVRHLFVERALPLLAEIKREHSTLTKSTSQYPSVMPMHADLQVRMAKARRKGKESKVDSIQRQINHSVMTLEGLIAEEFLEVGVDEQLKFTFHINSVACGVMDSIVELYNQHGYHAELGMSPAEYKLYIQKAPPVEALKQA